jgi:hypothetical protein
MAPARISPGATRTLNVSRVSGVQFDFHDGELVANRDIRVAGGAGRWEGKPKGKGGSIPNGFTFSCREAVTIV